MKAENAGLSTRSRRSFLQMSAVASVAVVFRPMTEAMLAGAFDRSVPQDAVLNSGHEQTVFVVHEGGNFEPRKVTLGPVVDGNVVVLSGLKAGETIVTSGNFLVDSESRMKSATAEMR